MRKPSHGGVIASRLRGVAEERERLVDAHRNDLRAHEAAERRRAGEGRSSPQCVGARHSCEPAQESVWDYPRPPRLERSARRVRIVLGGGVIADSTRAHRVLETSHPPVYYVPLDDVAPRRARAVGRPHVLRVEGRRALLRRARRDGRRVERAAWTYLHPSPAFAAIRDASRSTPR